MVVNDDRFIRVGEIKLTGCSPDQLRHEGRPIGSLSHLISPAALSRLQLQQFARIAEE